MELAKNKLINNKLVGYLKGSFEELKKVTWPSKKETTRHTLVVIGFSIVVAIFISIVDFVFTKLLEIIV